MMEGIEAFHHEISSKGYRYMRPGRSIEASIGVSFASSSATFTKKRPASTAREDDLGRQQAIGPDYPCVLVSDRDRRAVITAPLAKLVDPHTSRVCFSDCHADDRSCAMYEKRP